MRLASVLAVVSLLGLSGAAFGQDVAALNGSDDTGADDPLAPAATPAAVAPKVAVDDTSTGSLPNPREKPVAAEPPVEAGKRTADPDPYEALGVRAGSFILYPSVEVGVGYSNNAVKLPGGGSSAFGTITPEVDVQSDWSRHDFALKLRGTFEKFSDGTVGDMPSAEAEATARLDLADGWQANFAGTYNFDRESVDDAAFPPGTNPTTGVSAYSVTAGITRDIGPGEFTFEGRADRTTYSDAIAGGTSVSQSDRDNTLFGARVRVGYAVSGLLKPFLEGEVTRRVFDEEIDSGGVDRESRGVAVRAGLAFDNGPLLSGEVAVGARREDFDDAALASIKAFTLDGSLVWSPTPLTNVSFDLSTVVNPGTDPASSGSVERNAAVNIDYAWRDNVTLNLKAEADREHFEGTGETDRTYTVGAGVTWKLNRKLWLTAGYEHEWLASSDPSLNYRSDTVRVDLRLQH